MKTKRLVLFSIVFILILVLFYVVSSGLTKNPHAELLDYTVSENGKELTFTIVIPISISYVRGFRDVGGGVKPHYLDFYNTYGGINSSWGAEFEFVLPLSQTDTEIYFNRDGHGYELVLQKRADTGEWCKVSESFPPY